MAEEGRYLAAPEGLRARRKNGDTFPVEATLCPIQLPDENQYLLILRNVEELRQAEEELDQLQSEKTYLQEELKSEYNFDEIGELPLDTQAKLLRALQHQEFERVGGSETIEVDTRILAATNRTLEAEVEAGRFRDDLYYRLNIFPIHLPPLRDRKDDIPLLAEHFCDMYASRTGTEVEGLSANAVAILEGYDWPGNVRELANVVERAVILMQGDWIRAEHLSVADSSRPGGTGSFDTLEEAQRRHIEQALEITDGVVGGEEGAAQLLDVKRTTLLSRMDRLEINPSEYRE